MNRRTFLVAGAGALGTLSALHIHASERRSNQTGRKTIPLVHITDLYHPPQDPDDHFDLATIAALQEYDLRAVVLDVTERFLTPPAKSSDVRRDPGFIPVMQLAYLLGRDIPAAAGPRIPLRDIGDDIADRTEQEQAGVRLLLDTLKRSDDGIVVSVVGSCRTLTAAVNRDRDLVRSRVHSVLLNAGSSGGQKQEWNVGLDPEAYKGLWQSGLPIHWYPCATERGAFDQDNERGTYWKTTHAELLRDVPPSLQAWFSYALARSSRADIIRILSEKPSGTAWEALLAEERNLWSTASLAMGAGRVLAKTEQGWRFIPEGEKGSSEIWSWRQDRIDATIGKDARVLWHPAENDGNATLFGRERRAGFGTAMAEALNALLRSFPG